jgi:type II secretory pathway pseudopilin PulG
VFSRYTLAILLAVLIPAGFSAVAAQEETSDAQRQETNRKNQKQNDKSDASRNPTAEQIAESAILVYAGLTGRDGLKQIRKTTVERGRISVTNPDGRVEQAKYERRILRGESLENERVRIDQEFPNARFALVYTGEKIFGLFNESVFAPREDAAKTFENQIWHGLEALLRYKENGSTLALAGREKTMGVDFYMLDVTDKQNRTTRFYVSSKTFRVMKLEYSQDGVKFVRRFYDYNYAQGTLVPYRTVLWANDRQVEETSVQTITFGQKVDEDLFREG